MSDIAKPNFHAVKVIILAQGVRISQLESELREAATAISTLRARVAELEALAAPQAGASEAEPVAGAMALALITARESLISGFDTVAAISRIDAALATPPDSDAVRALRKIAEGNLGDAPWQADYEKIREVARAALSGKGGSNGQ